MGRLGDKDMTAPGGMINSAVLDHQQAEENVARLEGQPGRSPSVSAERHAKPVELAQWRARFSASVNIVNAIRIPERTLVDRAEAKVARRLAGLYGQRELRDAALTGHPEAALRLANIDREARRSTLSWVARPQATSLSAARRVAGPRPRHRTLTADGPVCQSGPGRHQNTPIPAPRSRLRVSRRVWMRRSGPSPLASRHETT